MKKYNKKISIILSIIFILIICFLINYYIKHSNDKSYSRGIDTAFELIMKQAKNKNCDTINIKNDFEEIKLINIKCIK